MRASNGIASQNSFRLPVLPTAREIASATPIVLIAEGLPGGKRVLPRATSEETAVWRIIVDPIDGTRGLMYQKRSAWILTGVAPNRGADTNLSDIELAIQTEIPLIKQHLSDTIWACRGEGAHAERFNRITKETTEITLQPVRRMPDGCWLLTQTRSGSSVRWTMRESGRC